ncbi:hypothetical protein F5Y18DRAFT_435578 [Xylariaceae sp. FL1019]|nr:hypothetical protein F5Y18DRAFT_435578 [Xylariaceae sp. FL1019]
MYEHGWSFPSRGGFTRDKCIDDDDPTEPPKFSTVHIGQPRPHPTRNVSSAFRDLFGVSRNRRLRSDGPQLLATNENSNPSTSVKSYFFNESQDHPIKDRDAIPQDIAIRPVPGPSAAITNNIIPSSQDGLRDSSQVAYRTSEGPRMRSFSLSSSESQDTKDQNTFIPLSHILSSDTADRLRFRSVSSSYPSEGIRSPFSPSSSPKPVVPISNVAAEYCGLGVYPSRENWGATEVSLAQASPVTDSFKNHTVAPSGPYEAHSIPETWSAGTKNDYRHPIKSTVSNSIPKQIQAETNDCCSMRGNVSRTLSVRRSSAGQLSNPTSMIENPFLDPDTGSIARKTPALVDGSMDNEQSDANFRRTDSMENLYRSAATNETLETSSNPAFQPDQRDNNDQSGYPTRHPGKRKHSRGYWIDLFGLSSSTSPVDASHSVEKSKSAMWMKTMYSRTKAYLDHAVKPGHMRKPAHSKAKLVSFKWQHRKKGKKSKKSKTSKLKTGKTKTQAQTTKNKKNKKPEKKRRSVSEILGIKNMQTKAHKPTTNSLLIDRQKESKMNKTNIVHERVQSCPAAIE